MALPLPPRSKYKEAAGLDALAAKLRAMNEAYAARVPMEEFAPTVGVDMGNLPPRPGEAEANAAIAESQRRRPIYYGGGRPTFDDPEAMLAAEGDRITAGMLARAPASAGQGEWNDLTGFAGRMAALEGLPSEPEPPKEQQGTVPWSTLTRNVTPRTPEEKEWSRQAIRNRGIAKGLGINPAMFPMYTQAMEEGAVNPAQVMLAGQMDPHNKTMARRG